MLKELSSTMSIRRPFALAAAAHKGIGKSQNKKQDSAKRSANSSRYLKLAMARGALGAALEEHERADRARAR
jgi:hypothetical protein